MYHGPDQAPPDNDVAKWRNHGRVAAAVVGVCILGTALSFIPARPDADLAEFVVEMHVRFTVENDYERSSGRRTGDGLYPFDYVAAVRGPSCFLYK